MTGHDYWAMYEDSNKLAQHIDYARFRHFGAENDDRAIEFTRSCAPTWASGFVMYRKRKGYADKCVGTFDIEREAGP